MTVNFRSASAGAGSRHKGVIALGLAAAQVLGSQGSTKREAAASTEAQILLAMGDNTGLLLCLLDALKAAAQGKVRSGLVYRYLKTFAL